MSRWTSVRLVLLSVCFSAGSAWGQGGGKALGLDGIGDYMRINSFFLNAQSDPVSFSFWVKMENQPVDYNGLLRYNDGGTATHEIYYDTRFSQKQLKYIVSYNPSSLAAYDYDMDSQWHNITCVSDGTNPSVYLDGVLVATGPEIPSASGIGSFFVIGAMYDTGTSDERCLNGQMDEVSVWDRPLSEAEIQVNMNRSLTGNESGLVGYWNFDELDGSGMVPDLTGNGNDGTLVGDALLVDSTAPVNDREIAVQLPGGATMDFVWIEPGIFTMGSPATEPGREADEGPQYEVTISRGFYLGKYETTQEQWESVMGTTPWVGMSHVQSNPNHPAVHISWDDMQALIQDLNASIGEQLYRLPTEAEWEYACRAGTTTHWSFGDDEGQLADYAWNGGVVEYAQPVGTKLPNPWGLYDIHGNVWEWCADWYGTYGTGPQVDPQGSPTGSARVFRGGEFYYEAALTRSANRHSDVPTGVYYDLGARLVMQVVGVPIILPDTQTGYDQSLGIPVQIGLTSGAGIVSAEVFVSYDGDLLMPTASPVTTTAMTTGWTLEHKIEQGVGSSIDTIKIAMADEVVLSGSGDLVMLHFTVADQRSPASSQLNIEHALLNDGTPGVVTTDGSVTVIGTDGTITSTPDQIIPRYPIDVEVIDLDESENAGQQEQVTVQVKNLNNGDTETLILDEDGNDSDHFLGQIATIFSAGPTTSGDHTIQAQHGHVVEFRYTDVLDGLGQTIDRVTTTNVIGGADGAIEVTAVTQPGDGVRIRVVDPDLNTDPNDTESVTVTATNGAQSIDVVLTEVDDDDAAFTGQLPTLSSGGTGSEMITAKGDVVTVTYNDDVTALGDDVDLTDTDMVVDPFGDADGNGQIQAYDAAQVLLHRLSTMSEPPGAPVLVALDSLSANLDLDAPYGIIDGFDASLILRRVVGLQPVFPVQEAGSANHPGMGSAGKGIPEERLVVLREHEGYVSLWLEDRSSIVSGELMLSRMTGRVEMGNELSDFLSASRMTDGGIQVVFAGTDEVTGAGELLRVYGRGEDIGVDRVRFNGGSIVARVGENEPAGVKPLHFVLHANVPNPFNPQTTIRFELANESAVRLEVFDSVGQRVRTLVADRLPAGAHQAVWDGRTESRSSVSSGVYFCRLQAWSAENTRRSDASRLTDLRFSQVRRMLLLK